MFSFSNCYLSHQLATEKGSKINPMEQAYERFLRYIAIDTTSDEQFPSCPSTPGQLELARLLADEMRQMGVSNVRLDEFG